MEILPHIKSAMSGWDSNLGLLDEKLRCYHFATEIGRRYIKGYFTENVNNNYKVHLFHPKLNIFSHKSSFEPCTI